MPDDQTLYEPRPEPADVYVLVDLLIKEDGGLLLLEAGDADIGGNPPSLALET